MLIFQVLLGFFGVGSGTVFFNDMLVSAFSFGSAVHVLTSQIPQLLGITIGKHAGPLKVPLVSKITDYIFWINLY
mgnify:CR=1 FL=1